MLLGVDTGGTFTDFVLIDAAGMRVHKVLSTPHQPEQAILQGVSELGLSSDALTLIHGSTVATNAVLEGKGVRTVFITNRGFADMLSIGRQARKSLYDLQPAPVPGPVPVQLCLETGGRLDAHGEVVEDLTQDDLDELVRQLRELKPDAVAVNLLFSFLDDRFEQAIASVVDDSVFVSLSSAILPEYREYERGIATWLNAWIGPLVQAYLQRLTQQLPKVSLSVMQSSGGTIDSHQAGEKAVNMLLSGPAGGLQGARFVAKQSKIHRLLTFDMGGTSSDVAMIDGDVRLTSDGHIAGYPVGVPMVDMHTIGAGGGSIAYVDAGGMLQVGPESAGADPGPACYGKSGPATVTDANLMLGRLLEDAFLGGHMALDRDASQHAIGVLAQQMDCSIESVAEGIVAIANEHMVRALRVISVERGIDVSDFTLVSFGGAGGLHVCALADALGIAQALVPLNGGVLSALGMLTARRSRTQTRSICRCLSELGQSELDAWADELAAVAAEALLLEGLLHSQLEREVYLDVRYQGQSHFLSIEQMPIEAAISTFHQQHQARYGHRMALAVELVNIRVSVFGPIPDIHLPACLDNVTAPNPERHIQASGIDQPIAVFERSDLGAGWNMKGPVLITESVATTWVDAGWHVEVDSVGNLQLKSLAKADV